ncbi:MAG: hypothetical protein ACLFPV_05345, partial [Spirochaetaceae bacterium]
LIDGEESGTFRAFTGGSARVAPGPQAAAHTPQSSPCWYRRPSLRGFAQGHIPGKPAVLLH